MLAMRSHFLTRTQDQICFANLGRYPSGQRGQTVNLLAHAFGGSNPSLPTKTTETAVGHTHAQDGQESAQVGQRQEVGPEPDVEECPKSDSAPTDPGPASST